MAVDVSIIIVNYNSGQYLPDCVESIYAHTKGISFEIIVVDNNSTDDSFCEICEKFVPICGLKNPTNLGFGAANNIGARKAAGKYLFFLNPDTILTDDAVSAFYKFLTESNPQIAACGGRMQKPDGEYAVSFGHFPTLFQHFSDIGFRVLFKGFYNKRLSLSPPCNFTIPQQVDYISGADIFIRSAVFEKLDGFDEHFFMYYEDTDLFYRLSKAGYQTWLLPQVKIIHHESPAAHPGGSFNYTKYSMLEKSKYLYFAKNHGAGSVFWVKLFQLFELVFHYFGRYRYSLPKTVGITLKA